MNTKLLVVILLLPFAGVLAAAFLGTETSCTGQISSSGYSYVGHQTYWEKLVGGTCHRWGPGLPE